MEESVDHLLEHCEVAREMWIMLFLVFEVSWVMPTTIAYSRFLFKRGSRRLMEWPLYIKCGAYGVKDKTDFR